MNWQAWQTFFHTEHESLSKTYPPWPQALPPSSHGISEAFHNVDLGTSETIEAAIGQYAASGNWPGLSPEAGSLLLARIEFAQDLCQSLVLLGHSVQTPVPPAKPTAEFLHMMLCTLWDAVASNRTGKILDSLQELGKRHTPSKSGNGQ